MPIKPLYDAFRGPGSVVLAGKSTNPDYDILQLQSVSTVKEDSFNVRLDQKLNTNWSVYGRYFRDQGTNDQPEGVTGRRSHIEANPSNAIVALQGILSSSMLNELKFGYNAAPTSIDGIAPTVNGIDLSQLTHQPDRQRREHRHRRPGRELRHRRRRAACCARTAPPTAAARRTTRTRSRSSIR